MPGKRVSKRGGINEGKPPLSPDEPTVYIQVRVPLSYKQYVQSQPGGEAKTIRRLIEEDRKRTMATMTTTNHEDALQAIRAYLGNNSLTINDLGQVELTETGQTFGQVFTDEDQVTEHLRTLTLDKGDEWHGVDKGDLYSEDDCKAVLGVAYLGDDVWYQDHR